MKNKFLLCLPFLFLACQKETLYNPERTATYACSSANPTRDLPWLKAKIEQAAIPTDYCTPSTVIGGIYRDKTVFIIPVSGALCCPCAGNSVYDCEGKLLFVCNTAEEANIKNKVVLWERQ